MTDASNRSMPSVCDSTRSAIRSSQNALAAPDSCRVGDSSSAAYAVRTRSGDASMVSATAKQPAVTASRRQVSGSRFAAAYAHDERHAVFRTEDLVDPSVMLATEHDGAPIGRRHGGSVRLISPLQYGYKSAKHLKRIEFAEEQPDSSFGKKEHLRARVANEERHSTVANWLLRTPYRLTVVPTALAADRGLNKSARSREGARHPYGSLSARVRPMWRFRSTWMVYCQAWRSSAMELELCMASGRLVPNRKI